MPTHDEREPSSRVLPLDASSTGVADGGRGVAGYSMRSPVLAGIIGALRAWTVAMISALSIPWR